MQTWKIVLIVVAVVAAALAAAALWFRHYRRQKEKARIAAMSPQELELYEATKEHGLRVLQAKKALGSLAKDWQKTVGKAEKSLKAARALGTQKLGSWGTMRLWESRIETQEGTAYFSSGSVTAAVDAAGTLTVQAPSFVSTTACQPKDVPKAVQFATKVNNAAASWSELDQQARAAVAAATEQLVKAHAGKIEALTRAEYALEDARRDTARIDAAKAALQSAPATLQTAEGAGSAEQTR